MPDHNERFARLMDAVEAQGGELLPGACKARTVRYSAGVEHVKITQEPAQTMGCGMERRFLVPDRMFADEPYGDPKQTTACMNDDLMALWPRFADAMYEESE